MYTVSVFVCAVTWLSTRAAAADVREGRNGAPDCSSISCPALLPNKKKHPPTNYCSHPWGCTFIDCCEEAPKPQTDWCKKTPAKRANACAPVVSTFSNGPGKTTLRMAEQGAIGIANLVAAASAAYFPVGAWVAGAAVVGIMNVFFPSTGPPENPCTYAKEWGECVWEQVMPMVEKFVDEKFDEKETQEYLEWISGFKSALREVNVTIQDDAERDSNGNITRIPDSVYYQMKAIDSDMVEYAPRFEGKGSPLKSAMYLAQFASLHINLKFALFSACNVQSNKDLLRQRIATYISWVRTSVDKYKGVRFSSKYWKESHTTYKCWNPTSGLPYDLYQNHWTDSFPNCSWHTETGKECVFDPFPNPNPNPYSPAARCADDHQQWVKNQQNQFWQENALSAIPLWQKIADKLADAKTIPYEQCNFTHSQHQTLPPRLRLI